MESSSSSRLVKPLLIGFLPSFVSFLVDLEITDWVSLTVRLVAADVFASLLPAEVRDFEAVFLVGLVGFFADSDGKASTSSFVSFSVLIVD